MFGNTRTIAEAIASSLAGYGQTELVEVSEAVTELDSDVDLLVVGGPTHAHGMSHKSTRDNAAKQVKEGIVSGRIGLREWLPQVKMPDSVPVATFDTRFDKPRWFTGSAARGAAKRLRRRGHRMLAPPESFYVTATTGPLAEGETERAHRWGDNLGKQAFDKGTQV
jgi:flavodoxin